MSAKHRFIALTEEIRLTLRYMAEIGCPGFDCTPETLKIIKQWGKKSGQLPVVSCQKATDHCSLTTDHHPTDRCSLTTDHSLPQIRADIGDCQRCALCANRKNIVFGSGNPKARLVFVGECPGQEEDETGEPFVGAAGQLLTKIISAMTLTREQVYICNIVKCRPPGNRNPLKQEIESCIPFLKRQISVIKPDFICALGAVSAQTLLNTKKSISDLRGNFYDYMGIKLMPTYHPSYLLRLTDPKKNKERKSEVWDDMKKIMEGLGIGRK